METTGYIQEQQGQIRFCEKTSRPAQFWKNTSWFIENKMNLYQNDGKTKYGKRQKLLMI